jgi:hypothetical protein
MSASWNHGNAYKLYMCKRQPQTFIRVAEPQHFNVDPVPDPTFHFSADPDPAFHSYAVPDLAFHFNADTVPDPAPQSDVNLRPLFNRPSGAPF